MARQWYAIEDRQTPGDEFGMHRLYTAEEWLDQAIDWLESDKAFDESDAEPQWQSPEKFREIWTKKIQKDPQSIIDFIDNYWEITMVEQGVDGNDYYTDFPEDEDEDGEVEGCTVTGSTEPTETEDINPGNIYEYAVKRLPAEDIDHHESDLYIRKTPESTALINKMKYKDCGLLTTFRSNIAPHDTWYELPFCYTPDWRTKMMGSLPIQNATTVKASRWYYREPMSEEELQSLENDILAIPGCDKVEIHTDGMEELGQLIIMPFYGDIHFDESITDPYKRVGKYSEEQKAMKQAVLEVAKDHGLTRTGDRIEDYGSCYYMVFNTNKPKTDKYDEY